MRRLVPIYQLAAGLCDTSTGLLLLLAPVWTLRLMGVSVLPAPPVFASYIGAFVLGVGLSYWWTYFRYAPPQMDRWAAQWEFTALIRAIIAGFVLQAVVRHQLDGKWISVAVTDGCFAVVQVLALKGGWLERDAVTSATRL